MMRLLAVVLLSISLFAQAPLRLAEVRKIYIEKMPNNLDKYLRSSILKTFRDRVTVVLEPSLADAILTEVPMEPQQTKPPENNTKSNAHEVLGSGTPANRERKFLCWNHGVGRRV